MEFYLKKLIRVLNQPATVILICHAGVNSAFVWCLIVLNGTEEHVISGSVFTEDTYL